MPLEEAVEVEAPRARDWKCHAFGIRRGREGSPRGRARVTAILHALALTAGLAWANPVAAQDDNNRLDGLNSDLRESLYNQSTSLVARLDLTQLLHDGLIQTFRGLFDPSEYAILLNSSKGFEQGIEQSIAGPAAVAGALVAANYPALTVAVLQYQGSRCSAPCR